MPACLWGSAIMLALCLAITFMLPTGVAVQARASLGTGTIARWAFSNAT